MGIKNKKIIYISNVNLEGPFLLGVIEKIKGQFRAFTNLSVDVDLLYPDGKGNVIIQRCDGKKNIYAGSRDIALHNGVISKTLSHIKVSWFGSINFDQCADAIVKAGYDAVYLRFYLPGTDLIRFLKRMKKGSPSTILFLEYPTINIKNIYSKDIVRSAHYYLNSRRIMKLNGLADYIITLTRHETLYGRPAIFMANGIETKDIHPIAPPAYDNKIILMGVASDCAFYHGFDKVIRGLAHYARGKKDIGFLFRIVSNPLSRNVDELKKLAKELGVEQMVSFEVSKTRDELAIEYGKVHLGMGTLALHRVGLSDNYSLKHREYAAFGLPFVMSEGDEHFEHSPFVHTVKRDEEPLDIQQVVDFYLSLRAKTPSYPQAFRKSVEEVISWEVQLQNIVSVLNKV